MEERFTKIRYVVLCTDGETLQIRKCMLSPATYNGFIVTGFIVIDIETRNCYKVLSCNIFDTAREAEERRSEILLKYGELFNENY